MSAPEEPSQPVIALFPLNGMSLDHAMSEQPELTTIDLWNCWPFDPHGRMRGAQRPGTTLLFGTPIAASSSGSSGSSSSGP